MDINRVAPMEIGRVSPVAFVASPPPPFILPDRRKGGEQKPPPSEPGEDYEVSVAGMSDSPDSNGERRREPEPPADPPRRDGDDADHLDLLA